MTRNVEINTESPINARVLESRKVSNVGIVLAHDVTGIDQDMEERMEYWSAMGYTVVVPDLFCHENAGDPLPGEKIDDMDAYRAVYSAFDIGRGGKDIKAAVTFARELGCHGVGVLGFGLGGLLAYLAAVRAECDVAISYCGLGIEHHLVDAAPNEVLNDSADNTAEGAGESVDAGAVTRAGGAGIEVPLSIYMAEEDALVDSEAQAAVMERYKGSRIVRAFVHPYVRHNFARWDSRQRDRCALTLAEHRAGEFFYMNLTLKHWQTRPSLLESESA